MGPDGHTASLFPAHAALHLTGVAVTGISNSPKPPPERVTLTLPALDAARNVIFVVTGADKAAAVAESLSYDTHISPAGLVRPHNGYVMACPSRPLSYLIRKKKTVNASFLYLIRKKENSARE